jgi:chemotaxis protein MotB
MAGSGGAWKVAYADFVTAMMAFFLVMWITGQSQDTKESISGYFRDPWGTSSEHMQPTSLLPSETQGNSLNIDIPKRQTPGHKPGNDSQEGSDEDVLSKSKWAQKRKVHFVEDNDRSTPALVVNFEESSAQLSSHAKVELDRMIPGLLGKMNMIEIRGHSTRRPLPEGSPHPDLWALCFARCEAVMRYLEERGVESARLRLSQSAAYQPLTNRVEEAWQSDNSRAEVFLLDELAEELPGTQGGDPSKTKLSSADPAHR